MKLQLKWRKIFRVLHRDLGYFFFGAIVVYGLSGIALNHRRDWNPSYVVHTAVYTVAPQPDNLDADQVRTLLAQQGITGRYKKHYAPDADSIRIFIDGGTATLMPASGQLTVETVSPRPFFHTANKLHFNPGNLWTWFSDFFAVSLILISVTGLFLLRGKNGMRWRGTILVALGILIPGVIAFFSIQ
ncbi:MAG: PepSY-associated TM helix domain-containing protein [Opitutales bacterium]|nr:PepSY-associated TM helix domain-containing protein [Opitutales bacterium]